MRAQDFGLTKEKIMEIADKYMIHTNDRFSLVAETAKDLEIKDVGGEAYLDFFAGIAVNSAGNNNEKVVEAIKEQADCILHTSLYPYSVPQALLARLICETLGYQKIFFQNSGTEANEAMIKMARKYGVENYGEHRYHIVSARKSFHGRTYGSLSATGQPDNACQTGLKPMLPGFSYADFNHLESFRNACTEDTIAIMLEPIQGEAGVYPATQEFMRGIRRLCDEKKLLLLFDEVQTGWCRTGETMGYMHYGIKPDIVTMAKGMGGGMPIGAVCTSEKISNVLTGGTHASTYGGNPVCCAAAYAQINELLKRGLAKNAKYVGDYFMGELKDLPKVREVRGKGLLIAVEFEEVDAVLLKHVAQHNKLLITATSENTIRMVPPLIATKADCDNAYSILKASLISMEKLEGGSR